MLTIEDSHHWTNHSAVRFRNLVQWLNKRVSRSQFVTCTSIDPDVEPSLQINQSVQRAWMKAGGTNEFSTNDWSASLLASYWPQRLKIRNAKAKRLLFSDFECRWFVSNNRNISLNFECRWFVSNNRNISLNFVKWVASISPGAPDWARKLEFLIRHLLTMSFLNFALLSVNEPTVQMIGLEC